MNAETSLGEWLKQQRKRFDLTQEALADQVGCSRDTVRKIEMGLRRPSRQVAELLAERFHMPAEQREAFMHFARGSGGDLALPIIMPVTVAFPAGNSNNSSLRLAPDPLNNLPAPPTPFIGREKELEKLAALIVREGVRMVTLTGPGGIGKTRLALHVAKTLLEDFDGGVFFVPLASIRDPDLVIPAVSEVLGVREIGNQPALETLKGYLRD
jgi:transcriptional regulator with XRE-family HTH domain